MSGRMRVLILSCVAVLVIGGAAIFTPGAPTRAHAPVRAIRVADVDRAVTPRRRSAPSVDGGWNVCFVGADSTSGQACGDAACAEFVDVTITVPRAVIDGSRCAKVATRATIVRGRSLPVAGVPPLHGTLRSRLRTFAQHLPR